MTRSARGGAVAQQFQVESFAPASGRFLKDRIVNSFLACATVAQSPTHAIITAESLAGLAGLLFAFFSYARHQAAARDPGKRPVPTRALMVALGGWLGLCLAIPVAVHALSGSGWPTWSVCAPAPILQCVGWVAVGALGVAWIVSRDTFAHLRERRATGQPAFAPTVPMQRPYSASRLAPESKPAPHALRELLRMQPSTTVRQQARAEAAVWARHGPAGRFLDSQ